MNIAREEINEIKNKIFMWDIEFLLKDSKFSVNKRKNEEVIKMKKKKEEKDNRFLCMHEL